MKTVIFCLITLGLVACAHKPAQPKIPPASKSPDKTAYIKNLEARQRYVTLRKDMENRPSKDLVQGLAELSKAYPEEVIIKASYAALLGDYGQELSAEEEKRKKAEAVKILEPMTTGSFDDPVGLDRLVVFNEYYYHSANYRKQFELGEEFNDQHGPGDFSVGVGGAMYARQLLEQKKRAEALKYASAAQAAWERYAKHRGWKTQDELYRNPFYVLAVGIGGRLDLAQKYFDEYIKKRPEYAASARWWNQFDPQSYKKWL